MKKTKSILLEKADKYAHGAYRLTRLNLCVSASFPGLTGESNAGVVRFPIGVGNDNASKHAGATRDFPEEEKFGITSQLRRSALSTPLNITEGFARQSDSYYLQFLKTAYSSLKEAQYLLKFAKKEGFGKSVDSEELYALGDEIGAMLWKKIQNLEEAKND